MATLLNRYIRGDGQAVMTLQDGRTGAILDVMVAAADEQIAQEYWAGSQVPVVERDGKLWFDRQDSYTDAEVDQIEKESRLAAARTYAPGATDDQLIAVLDAPMSQRQRVTALRALHISGNEICDEQHQLGLS